MEKIRLIYYLIGFLIGSVAYIITYIKKKKTTHTVIKELNRKGTLLSGPLLVIVLFAPKPYCIIAAVPLAFLVTYFFIYNKFLYRNYFKILEFPENTKNKIIKIKNKILRRKAPQKNNKSTRK